MKISVFKSLKNTSAVFNRNVFFVLDRIKNGASKDLVNKIRLEKDKQKRNDLKQQLPCICFSGIFSRRSSKAIEAHSGLICLDFDNYTTKEEIIEYRAYLEAEKHSFAVFTSPSGDGLKVLVKIPAEVENHKLYFNSLKEHYNSLNFDVHCSDVARVCYESYDPDIFINPDSIVWDKKEEAEVFVEAFVEDFVPDIRLLNENKIIQNLHTWFEGKYDMTEGSRNTNLYKIAIAFNDFGVSKYEALNYCKQYQSNGFDGNEIERIVDSAYFNKDKFGTKFFEDKELKNTIKRMFRYGWSKKQISKDIGINEDTIERVYDKEVNTSEVFWEINAKNGSVNIVPNMFKTWLESEGFFKYYPEEGGGYIFVRRVNNLIEDVDEAIIKDFVLNHLYGLDQMNVYNYFVQKTRYFKDDFLNFLGNAEIEFKKDTIDTSYLYYRNCCVEVKKDSVNTIDYLDLDKFVWKKHVINRDFKKSDYKNNDYRTFLWNISGKNKENYNSIRSSCGYLMHSYKNKASNVSISMSDETISEDPNGGTGKGLFMSGIANIKRVAVIDGKTFSFDKSFPYQTINADTQIILFDDVKKNFEFERLFSVITEGITLEKKNKDAIKIPVERSPKVAISSNYPIAGVGASFERRKFEIEFKQHYTPRFTPLDEFGKLLFDEWSSDEWASFDSYMIRNIQVYLKNGLIKSEFNNLKDRKLISSTNFDFAEWASDDNIKIGTRIYKKEVYNQFIEEYPDFKKWLTMKRLTQWISRYGEHLGHKVSSGRSQDGRWILIENGSGIVKEEEELF